MAYLYSAPPAQPVNINRPPYVSQPQTHPAQQQYYPQQQPYMPMSQPQQHYGYAQAPAYSQPQPQQYQYYADPAYAQQQQQHQQQPYYPPQQPSYMSHAPVYNTRPLPRPLPQAPAPQSFSRQLPQQQQQQPHPAPPPVPDHASRPTTAYAPPAVPRRNPLPTPGIPPPEREPSIKKPLPPDPNQRQPRPVVAQPPRTPSPSPAAVPSIAVHAEEDHSDENPAVPTFSFSGPDEKHQEDKGEAPAQQSQPSSTDGQPAFSVSVAPPSPPTLKESSSSASLHQEEEAEEEPQQTGRTDGSVTTIGLASEMVCGGCNLPIGGRIVSAMRKRWHPDCFKCDACGEGLEHVAFYEADDKPYCHIDYHERFSRRCHHCKTPIESETYVTLDDPVLGQRFYHELHFFCAECGDPFIDPKSLSGDRTDDTSVLAKPFVVQDGWPYCEKCNVQLHKPKCAGCKKPIEDDEVLSALNKQWHEDCFVCQSCKEPFEDSFLLKEGEPYCEPCYRVALRSDV